MSNTQTDGVMRFGFASHFSVALSLLLPQPFGIALLFRKRHPQLLSADRSLPLFIALSIFLFLSALLGYVHEGKGWTYGLKISATVSLCLAAGYFYNRVSPVWDLARALRIAGTIHVSIVLLEFFFPQLKSVTTYVSRMDPSLKLDVSYRLSGLFDGFDIAGVFLGVCAMSEASALRSSGRGGVIRAWAFILLFAVGSILCSRTGILIAIFAMLYATLRNPISIFPNSLLLVFFMTFAMNDDRIGETFYFMFDIVFNYVDGGGFSNTSSRDLVENNWFMPASSVFGNGGYPWSGGVDSDVAYVQVLPILGYVGGLVFVVLYSAFFVLIIKRAPNFWWLVPVLAIASLKGAYFWSPPLLLLCAFAAFYRGHSAISPDDGR